MSYCPECGESYGIEVEVCSKCDKTPSCLGQHDDCEDNEMLACSWREKCYHISVRGDKPPAVMKTCKTCGRTPPMCYCKKEPADAETPLCSACGKPLSVSSKHGGCDCAGNSPRKPLRGTSSRKLTLTILEIPSQGNDRTLLLRRDFVLEEELVPFFLDCMTIACDHPHDLASVQRFIAAKVRGDSDE